MGFLAGAQTCVVPRSSWSARRLVLFPAEALQGFPFLDDDHEARFARIGLVQGDAAMAQVLEAQERLVDRGHRNVDFSRDRQTLPPTQ